MRARGIRKNERGSALFVAVGYLVVISIFATAFLTALNRTATHATHAERKQICLALAEAGLDKALAELRAHPETYRGEKDTPLDEGRFSVEVVQSGRARAYRIVSTGGLFAGEHALAEARVAADVVLASSGKARSLSWTEVKRW